MKSKWNTATASKVLSHSKYGDKLVCSRKSHCDGKSEIWPWQPVTGYLSSKETAFEAGFPAQNLDRLLEKGFYGRIINRTCKDILDRSGLRGLKLS